MGLCTRFLGVLALGAAVFLGADGPEYLTAHLTATPAVSDPSAPSADAAGPAPPAARPLGLSSPEELRLHFTHARVLVVGGTAGIGRGIAEEAVRLAPALDKLTVVGRNAVAGEELRKLAKEHKAQDQFEFVEQDLYSTEGCQELIDKLTLQKTKFTHVFVSVGVWPDVFGMPVTEEGYDKLVMLDFIARHTILSGLRARKLLAAPRGAKKGAKPLVFNILASARAALLAPPPDVLKGRFAKFDAPSLRAAPWWEKLGFLSSLPVAAWLCDAWASLAAANYPDLTVVGTFPGIVDTDVANTLLGEAVPAALKRLLKWGTGGKLFFPIALAGRQHLSMAVHTRRLAMEGAAAGRAWFMDHRLYLREPGGAAADARTLASVAWLWDELDRIAPDFEKASPPAG